MVEGIIVNTGQFISKALKAICATLLAIYNGNAKAVDTLQGVLGQRLFALAVSALILFSAFGYYKVEQVKRNPLVKTVSMAQGVGNSVGGLFKGRK